MPDADLIAVGNELLTGEVQDTNLLTLIRRLTHSGFTVRRAAMVRDVPDDLAALFLSWLSQPADVLILSGGLGPTADDRTLETLAGALNRPLVEDPQARALVEQQYARLQTRGFLQMPGPEAARQKMAGLPQGARPLPNPIGTAPGVQLEVGPTLIFCLPGVPAELLAIYETAIEPQLHARFGRRTWIERTLIAVCDDEAQLAGPLQAVAERFPTVYIKSLARPFPAAQVEGLRIMIAAHTPAPGQADETALVEQVMAALIARLREAGITVSIP